MSEWFRPADILLPQDCDLHKWSVVACDQYTSEPDYWKQVESLVGSAPSTLRLMLPEIYLDSADVEKRIAGIHAAMRRYRNAGLLREEPDTFVYVERTLHDGSVRRGLVGAVDLEAYDFAPGSQTPIRATEGTVLERIPPRVRVRQGASLELPHIMLLIDDTDRTVLEPLAARSATLPPLYDFELMQGGGRLRGFAVRGEDAKQPLAALAALSDKSAFEEKYKVRSKGVLVFAAGDGNHSLATARQCWLSLRETLPEAERATHPARFALVEVVNLHDPSLRFEPIHRLLFDVDPEHLFHRLRVYYDLSTEPCNGQAFEFVSADTRQRVWVRDPVSNLAAGTLQAFLDRYLESFGGRVDYIHGEDVVLRLASQPRTAGFLLPKMKKSELFPTVILDGALPRKTFSMGRAQDKRFYFEARRIQ